MSLTIIIINLVTLHYHLHEFLLLYSFPFLLSSCKERLVVYGISGKGKYVKANSIFIQSGTSIVHVFEVYADVQKYHPIVVGYASTIHKVMGQT